MATDPDEGPPIEDGPGGERTAGREADEAGIRSDERTWGIVVHAAAFAGAFVPFGNILGPLVVWLIKKDDSEFVDENGKQALNFQLTWTAILLVALLSVFVFLGFLLVPLVLLAWLIFVVLAMIRASEEEVYDYPLTIDFVS